jgi:FAD/FMN-containing dehydrogenase
MPRGVVTPHDAEDVAHAVEWARAAHLSLVPRGGATGMPGGNVGPGVVLDLTRLTDITPPDEASEVNGGHGYIEAGAGAVAEDVDRVARRRGRHLAALPSSAAWCTVGGMVACDAAGARSFGHGPTHDQVLALEVVRSDGTLEWLGGDTGPSRWTGLRGSLGGAGALATWPWPSVRKNSSGYALDRFLTSGNAAQLVVGSEGTLAVVTRAHLRTLPLPEHAGVCLLGVPHVDVLAPLALEAERLGATACEYFGAALLKLAEAPTGMLDGLCVDAGALLLEFRGSRAAVETSLAEAESLARDQGKCRSGRGEHEARRLWEIRHAASPTIARAARRGLRSLQFMEDGVVPPEALGAYLSGVEAILARHETTGVVFGHAGDGNLHVNPLVDVGRADWRARVRSMLEQSVTLVTELGGTLAGEHGDGRLRAPFLERVWGPGPTAAFQQVKDALDPEHILNPGVVLALPGQDPLAGFGDGPEAVGAVGAQ